MGKMIYRTIMYTGSSRKLDRMYDKAGHDRRVGRVKGPEPAPRPLAFGATIIMVYTFNSI